MRLGKHPARFDSRTLRLADYVPNLGTYVPESEVDYSKSVVDWGVLKNDVLGDCTIAACAHAVQVCWLNHGDDNPHMETVPDATVVGLYSAWCGYDPTNPVTDRGGVELEVLNNWRQSGFAGHKLIAYVALQPQNRLHVKHAISRFGGTYIGLQLPVSCQRQPVWDVVPRDGGVWGGHAVYCLGFDSEGITCVTWGRLQKLTWRFWEKYCDEAFALLMDDWLGALSRGPDGIDMAKLQAELQAVTG